MLKLMVLSLCGAAALTMVAVTPVAAKTSPAAPQSSNRPLSLSKLPYPPFFVPASGKASVVEHFVYGDWRYVVSYAYSPNFGGWRALAYSAQLISLPDGEPFTPLPGITETAMSNDNPATEGLTPAYLTVSPDICYRQCKSVPPPPLPPPAPSYPGSGYGTSVTSTYGNIYWTGSVTYTWELIRDYEGTTEGTWLMTQQHIAETKCALNGTC